MLSDNKDPIIFPINRVNIKVVVIVMFIIKDDLNGILMLFTPYEKVANRTSKDRHNINTNNSK